MTAINCGNTSVLEFRISVDGNPEQLWARLGHWHEFMIPCGPVPQCHCDFNVMGDTNHPSPLGWVDIPLRTLLILGPGQHTFADYIYRWGRGGCSSGFELLVWRLTCPNPPSGTVCLSVNGLCDLEQLLQDYQLTLGCLNPTQVCQNAPDPYWSCPANPVAIEPQFPEAIPPTQECRCEYSPDDGCQPHFDWPNGTLMNSVTLANYTYPILVQINYRKSCLQDFVAPCEDCV